MYVKCDLEPVEFTPVTKFPEHAWCTVKSKDGIQLLIGICYHFHTKKLCSRLYSIEIKFYLKSKKNRFLR